MLGCNVCVDTHMLLALSLILSRSIYIECFNHAGYVARAKHLLLFLIQVNVTFIQRPQTEARARGPRDTLETYITYRCLRFTEQIVAMPRPKIYTSHKI